jgi:hypothetical protein
VQLLIVVRENDLKKVISSGICSEKKERKIIGDYALGHLAVVGMRVPCQKSRLLQTFFAISQWLEKHLLAGEFSAFIFYFYVAIFW